ncbi:MAG TPA: peptidase, partial [Burkholderiaceae bacterium]
MTTPDPRRGAPAPRISRRMAAVAWLRKTHGWIGLWGATLGLLFGFSGFWLNHRAVLKLEPEVTRNQAQIAVPDPGPADAKTMAAWLQLVLPIARQATSIRVEPAHPVAWADSPGARSAPAAVDGQSALAGVGLERSRSRERETDPGIAPASAAS